MARALACTVRLCGLPLERREGAWVCGGGHSFDVSRSGYVNLLQPQDRRSRHAGDSPAALDARAALLAAGAGRGVIEALVLRTASLDVPDGACVVDLGCGSGDLLAALAQRCVVTGIGIDLSTAAADRAARRFPDLTWVVANIDRGLPLLDRCTALAISLHGRRHPAECARVLMRPGLLIVCVPAPDDLVELREAVQGRGVERDRADAVIAEHNPCFDLVERSSVREQPFLEPARLGDLLRGTYRGGRHARAARAGSLGGMHVTLATDLLLFAPR